MFKKATKKRAKLRLALVGPSGSGKTYTALLLAKALSKGRPVAVIDSERGSASKYAGDVADFDVCELETFEPLRYVETIDGAAEAGYPVLVVDSLSHAWTGEGGALDQVDRRGGKFQAWREVTPMHRKLVDTILGYPGHVICTMRSKTEYVVEKDKRGRTEVRKVGLAPVMRDGVEYEFDVVGDMDHAHSLTVSKSRCAALADQVIRKPGADVAERLLAWLEDGEASAYDQVSAKLEAEGVESARALAGQLKSRMSQAELRRVAGLLKAAMVNESGEASCATSYEEGPPPGVDPYGDDSEHEEAAQ